MQINAAFVAKSGIIESYKTRKNLFDILVIISMQDFKDGKINARSDNNRFKK
jgi:hypothetical protein